VVTLMTSEQVKDVSDLTRAAGITATTTRVQGSSHPVLAELAPGERVLVEAAAPAPVKPERPARGGAGGGGRNRRRRSGGSQGRQQDAAAQPAKPRTKAPRSKRRTSAPAAGGRSHSAASFSAGRR
jgi:hypothetical protein